MFCERETSAHCARTERGLSAHCMRRVPRKNNSRAGPSHEEGNEAAKQGNEASRAQRKQRKEANMRYLVFCFQRLPLQRFSSTIPPKMHTVRFVSDRFHKRGFTVALISGGALLCILSLSAHRVGHTFRELFPNISSRTGTGREKR